MKKTTVKDTKDCHSEKSMPTTKPQIMSQFIGMHKYGLDWKNKNSKQISQELRESAWFENSSGSMKKAWKDTNSILELKQSREQWDK